LPSEIRNNPGANVSKLPSHIQALERGDPGSCRETMASLKQYQTHDWDAVTPREMQALVASLQKQLKSDGTQPFLRREITLIVGSIGPRCEAVIPQLRDLLHESVSPAIREAAASALGRMGKKARGAVNDLIGLLSTDRPPLVSEGVRALSNIGCADERVSAALANLWDASGSTVPCRGRPIPFQLPGNRCWGWRQVPLGAMAQAALQLEVALALCKLRIEAAGVLHVLTQTLVKSREVTLRKTAALALGWCGKTDPDVAPALLSAALKEKDEDVRQTAEASLRTLGLSHEKAVQLCARQLGDSAIAEATLKESGSLAVPCLREALEADEPDMREKAVRALGSLGEVAVDAVGDLTSVLRDSNLKVRLATAKSLWNITKKAELVVPPLVALLRQKRLLAGGAPDEARRRFLQTVIEALQRIGPAAEAAVPALTEKTRDENRIVSESARSALREIAPRLEVQSWSKSD
jgi:HEAT repeat protein